jgi:DNA modification methylase
MNRIVGKIISVVSCIAASTSFVPSIYGRCKMKTLEDARREGVKVNEIYCCDCLELMKLMPDKSVDLVLTDPPYGISTEMRIARTKNTMKFRATTDLIGNFGEWDKFDNIHQFMEYTYKWVDEVDKKLRDGGMFISYFDRDKINFLSHYLQAKGYKSKGYYADCKTNPVPQARKVKWMNGWEMVGMWQKGGGKLTYNYKEGQHKDYGLRPIVGGKERTKHPTQKPLSVIIDFIRWWSLPNDLIFDPFLGSGTTAVAAKMIGRNYIGCEISEEYCRIAEQRLQSIPLTIFEGEVIKNDK